MKTLERWVGNILAGLLILLVIISILHSAFVVLFRDGRGSGLYGGRGEFYMAE